MSDKAKEQKDSADQLLTVLSSESAEPDPQFAVRLQEQMLAATAERPGFLTIIHKYMQLNSKQVAMGFSAIFAVAIVIAGGAAAVITSNNAREEAELNDVFSALQSFRQSANYTEQGRLAAPTSDTAATSELSILPFFEPNTYRAYVGTVKAGPAESRCEGYYYYPANAVEVESYSFNDDQNNAYFKYVVRSSDGEIITYNTSSPDASYTYAGGDYAVMSPNDYYGIMPLATTESAVDDLATGTDATDLPQARSGESANSSESSASTVDDTVSISLPTEPTRGENGEFTVDSFFGENAKIEGKETIDGVEYTIASWSYAGYCNRGSDDSVFSRVWFDTNKGVVYKEETYLDSIAPNNLIQTSTNTSSTQIKKLSEVQSQLEFDLDVEVREIDPSLVRPGGEAYNKATINKFKQTGVALLVPNGYDLQSIAMANLDLADPFDYLQDEDFYSDTSIGKSQYNQAIAGGDLGEYEPTFIYSASFDSDKSVYYSLEVYELAAGRKEVAEEVARGNYDKTSVKVTIGSQEVTADLYQSSYIDEPGVPETVVDPETDLIAEYEFVNYQLVLEHNGNLYRFWVNGEQSDVSTDGIKFKSFDPTKTNGLNKITEFVNSIEAYNPVAAL